MTNRILITGGFGFIGGHLIEELAKDDNNRIHVVDNLSSNPLPLDILLDELEHPSNLTYDICSVEKFCGDNPSREFDQIYHLASPVGPAGVLKHAGQMIKVIVDDTYRLMDLALRNEAKLVDVSTSEVYGGGQDGYCSENQPKVVPPITTVRLEYAIGKLAAETAIINTCKVTELKTCIVRPFNIAGPRQSGVGGFVLPRFISLAMQNRPLTVFGDGRQVRAFTYVKDIARGLVKVMERGQRGEDYNLGNPHNKICILDLARRVVEVTSSKSEIRFVDPKKIYGPLYAEASDKYPDATRAINELEWQPTLKVDEIIEGTFHYMCQISRELFELLSGDV
jgi:UDP-glucose 4-epimerase